MKRLLITKREASMIILGVTILSLGLTWFLSPIGLVSGGIAGLAIVIEAVTGRIFGVPIPLWMTTMLFNLPLFLISIKQRGFGFAKKSLYAVLFTSFSMWYMQYLPNPIDVEGDLLLTAIFGGAGLGIGIGIVLRSSATTGGSDMLASIIRFKHPKFPIPQLMLCIDGLIILAGLFVFGPIKAMYAILSVAVTSKCISFILEGGHSAKAAFIISSQTDAISQAIMEQIPRGTTGLKARGMYSKKEKEVLYTVVSQKQLPKLREIIFEIDPDAFVTITDVKEVLGEGFIKELNALTH